MAKDLTPQLSSICSVTQMARQLELSRTRFYQLQKQGIFPMPVYCIHTRRPFYTHALQRLCLHIRKTGIGHNGRTILFYIQRKTTSEKADEPASKLHTELSDIMKQLGLKISAEQIKTALKKIYPKGVPPDLDEGLIIRDLFRYLG